MVGVQEKLGELTRNDSDNLHGYVKPVRRHDSNDEERSVPPLNSESSERRAATERAV